MKDRGYITRNGSGKCEGRKSHLELNPEFSILLEYNSALNENDMTAETMSISRGGYLNAALRWSFVESLHLELDLNNLLFDDEKVEYFKREIKITYIEYF